MCYGDHSQLHPIVGNHCKMIDDLVQLPQLYNKNSHHPHTVEEVEPYLI